MKFDHSDKFDFCYYEQANSQRLKSNVASKLLLNLQKQCDNLIKKNQSSAFDCFLTIANKREGF